MIISRVISWILVFIFAISLLISCDIAPDAVEQPLTVIQLADDTASTTSNRAVSIDLLRNDVIKSGLELKVTISRQPMAGTVTVDPASKRYIYTPRTNFFGSDSFEYQVCTMQNMCTKAQVRVVIHNDNVCSFFVPDRTVTITSNVSGSYDAVTIDLLASATICAPITSLSFGTLEHPQHGTVSYARDSVGTRPYFKCRYTPGSTFQVTRRDRFKCRVWDQIRRDSSDAIVTILGN